METPLHTPYYVDEAEDLRFSRHDGQTAAHLSRKRFVLVLAGTQSGKTVYGPWWLFREICRRGPGDYLVVAPSYPLMQKKVLPEFRALFERRLLLGSYHVADRIFQLSTAGSEVVHGSTTDTTQVFFAHAQDPDSLESATAKAAWLDEAGQKKFRLGSWEAIERRLSIHEGRALVTTTPYTLGWLKTELHDKALAGDADVDLIQFESTMNPVFPRDEFFRQREKLPAWKFDMMYRGRFTRPAGMIYDCLRPDHFVPRFALPSDWPRHLGLDFGGVNTAAVFLAEERSGTGRHATPTGRYFAYREYHAGSRTAAEHAKALLKGEPMIPRTTGGAASEGQWRREFRTGGLPVEAPPITEVEVGINRVYELLTTDRLFFFDDLRGLRDELESYGRELDDAGEPTEKIEDKAQYHRADALRYVCSRLAATTMDDWGQQKPYYG